MVRLESLMLDTLALLVALFVTSLGPGVLTLKWLCWHPLERLCCSLGLSFIFIYLLSFLAFELGLRSLVAVLITAGSVICFLAAGSHLRQLWHHRQTRRVILAFLSLFAWYMVQQLLIRHYGGANWWGDWLEHFQRSLFFLQHPKQLDFVFLTKSSLPARPPLMNLVVSHFLMINQEFTAFQILHTFLNALIFLPCCLLARRLRPRSGNAAWILLALFALSPYFSQNATYTWTKLFASFYVLTGVALYFAAWNKGDKHRMIAAFLAFAAGIMVHYSAAPYTLFVAAHYLLVLWRRRERRWQELSGIALLCGTLLLTWFSYSLRHYGVTTTLGSNTTIDGYGEYDLRENLKNISIHMVHSTVPFPFYKELYEDPLRTQVSAVVRETMFLLYQSNVLFALGSLSWLCIAVLFLQRLGRSSPDRKSVQRLWIGFLPTMFFFGMILAPINNRGDFGAAHICLQATLALGLVLLASQYPLLSWRWRGVVILGCLIDFVLGIGLHLHLLHDSPTAGRFLRSNWILKRDLELVFLGDLCSPFDRVIELLLIAGALSLLSLLIFARREKGGSEIAA